LNQDGSVNIVDAQLAVNMLLGMMPCTAQIAGPGVCNVVVAQRVINAVVGRPCVVDGAPIVHSATLTWTASTSPNVIGYNVYRRVLPNDSYVKVNSALITQMTYVDTAVVAGHTYAYVATAVDSSSTESSYSNEAPATIPSQ
jgi:hypothetical protein